MFGLQKIYEDETSKVILPEVHGFNLLENRLNEIGLYLTIEQELSLKEYLKSPSERITFDFSDEQILNSKVSKENLEKELNEVMQKASLDIPNLNTELAPIYEDLMENLREMSSSQIYTKLEKNRSEMLKNEIKRRKKFNKNLYELWEEPLSFLYTLIVIARETGDNYLNGQFHINLSMDLTARLLVRIQAKAIQVTEEILILLQNGFADGAEARWRTLHELTVILAFIAQHGDVVAEQYIDHELIEKYKKAKQHNKYYKEIGELEISLDYLEKEYLNLLDKYGDDFKSDYGWASSILGNKRPTFASIEASVEYDHYRPLYKSASANIHANSFGIFSRLGLLHQTEETILSGSSNSGLASVGQPTALSLVQITTIMLTYNSTVDSLVMCDILKIYYDKIDVSFANVENMMWEYME